MKKHFFILPVLYFLISTVANTQPINHEYFFNNSFAEYSTGPALAEIRGCGAGPGGYASQPIITTTSACANGANANVFSFEAGGGVQYPNTSGIVGKSYSIHVFFKFNTIGAWSRIIDFTNGTQDAGIYLLGNCLNFYPNGNVGPACPFVADKYYLMSFVRDSVSKIISVYVDGVVYATYNDAAGTYVPVSTNLPINFFYDDNVVGCEVKAGSIKYLSASNTPLPASGVDSVWRNICNIALPVKLGKLDATIRGKNAELVWSTFSESKSAYFSIERSVNGHSFSALGKVNAAGNSVETKKYGFVDRDLANGVHFYRLKMVDIDGSFSYSNVVKVALNAQVPFMLFPNPAKSVISVSGLSNQVNAVTITSIDGRIMLKAQLQGQSSTLNISQLAAGHYFLNYFDGKEMHRQLWRKE